MVAQRALFLLAATLTASVTAATSPCVRTLDGKGAWRFPALRLADAAPLTQAAAVTAPQHGVALVTRFPRDAECALGRARVVRYVCDAAGDVELLPLAGEGALGVACVTVETVFTPDACGAVREDASCATDILPLPTPDQQRYQRHEMMALTHFNMATFSSGVSCDPANWNVGPNTSNPMTFNPEGLNVSNWVASYLAVGVKHAVLTAKHSCGFLLWPTNTTLPSGAPYGYNVQLTARPSFQRNIVAEFVAATHSAGLGYGFYYSTGANAYLNMNNFAPAGKLMPGQQNVTLDEYNAIVFAQVKELWTTFGELDEIWFDGGYAGTQKDALMALLAKDQPHAVGFNGKGLMPSPVKWCGVESGYPKYPIWSTGCSSPTGDPTASDYCPTGVDTYIQVGEWFWRQNVPLRPLSQMIQSYHDSVGSNGVLELDFAIDNTGNIHADQAELYAAFGSWIRSCYDVPAGNTSSTGNSLTLSLAQATKVDRVMLQEQFEMGERVRAWTVEVDVNGVWQLFAQGTAIGYKHIAVAAAPLDVTAARINVTSAVAQPLLRTFALFAPCATGE